MQEVDTKLGNYKTSIGDTFSIRFSILKGNYKSIKMYNKLNEWWFKQSETKRFLILMGTSIGTWLILDYFNDGMFWWETWGEGH